MNTQRIRDLINWAKESETKISLEDIAEILDDLTYCQYWFNKIDWDEIKKNNPYYKKELVWFTDSFSTEDYGQEIALLEDYRVDKYNVLEAEKELNELEKRL